MKYRKNIAGLSVVFVTALIVTAVYMNGCGISSDDTFTLVKNGVTDYRIVVADTASHSTLHGAAELQRFIHEMTGAELPIVTDRMPSAEHEILLGKNARLDEYGIEIDFDKLGDEGYVIRTAGSRLVIAGGELRGTLYGVYGLLEDHFGCRWFTPDVSRIPQSATLSLPLIDEYTIPAIEYREPYVWEAFNGDWAARNRMNRNSKSGGLVARHGGKIEWVDGMFVHTFEKLVPPDEYFRRHPEYFSLVNGRRRKNRSQLCCTNDAVVKIVTEGVLKGFRENPEAWALSLSQNDWDAHCECRKCSALSKKEGSDIAPVLQMVNRVAEAVEEEFPDRVIETLAYQWTRHPPKTICPRHNVVIRLCTIECCFSHPLDGCDSEENIEFARDLREWSEVTDRLWVWNYVTSFAHYFVPFPNLRVRDDNIRFFTEHNVKAVLQQDVYSTPFGELSGLSGYLNAKLLWDPYYNEDKAINEFLDGVYGPAAEPVRAYIDMLHDKVADDNIHIGIWQGPNAEYLTDDILARADSLWDAAETLVKNAPDELVRVRIARLSVDYAIIDQGRKRGTAYLIDHENPALEIDPAFTGRVEKFCAVAEAAGIIKLKEYGYPIEEFRKAVEKDVKPKKLSWLKPSRSKPSGSGLTYRYFEGNWKKMPNFDKLKPKKTGTVDNFELPFEGGGEIYGFVFNGRISVQEDGVYSFFTQSDGYAAMTVGGRNIIKNSGNDPVRQRCGFAALKAGSYPVEVLFFTREGGTKLDVFYEGPKIEKRVVTWDMVGR